LTVDFPAKRDQVRWKRARALRARRSSSCRKPPRVRIVAGLAFLDESDCTHDLARRAEPTLEPVMSDERGLDRMQLFGRAESFQRRHIAIAHGRNRHLARTHGLAIEHHRARAALPEAATKFWTMQAEVIAQRVQEQTIGFYFELVILSVDF